MSGPKVSIYEMSARQRQNLRAQLNCIQQSIVCYEEIKKAVGYLNGLGGQIQSLLSAFTLINERAGDCSDEISTLNNIKSTVAQDCSSFLNKLTLNKPIMQVDKMTLTDNELSKKKDILAKLKSIQVEVVSHQKDIEESLQTLNRKAKQGIKAVENAIADDVSSVQSFYITPVESEDEKFESVKKNLEAQVRTLSLSDDCPIDLKPEVLSALSSMSRITTNEHLDTFSAVTIRPLLKKIDDFRSRIREQENIFNELQSRYAALCTVAQVQAKVFTADTSGIESLKEQIAALEKQVVMQTEQEYISDCVNEVMSEMGYDIIGNRSVTKRSGKRFRNELFSYGDGTAINVTYDADGQIAMELGGIDRTDRLPTSEEIGVLREDMESFCADFKDFEERLKAKGVTIKSRVSMASPTAEYATIINVSDYSITTTRPVSEIAFKGKSVRATAKQTLRKEDN